MAAPRPRNLSWDALVTATRANPAFERGRIASALAAIRECLQADGIVEDDWPAEILRRAEMYRQLWPQLTLTPTALARHWYRVLPAERSLVDRVRERYDLDDS